MLALANSILKSTWDMSLNSMGKVFRRRCPEPMGPNLESKVFPNSGVLLRSSATFWRRRISLLDKGILLGGDVAGFAVFCRGREETQDTGNLTVGEEKGGEVFCWGDAVSEEGWDWTVNAPSLAVVLLLFVEGEM